MSSQLPPPPPPPPGGPTPPSWRPPTGPPRGPVGPTGGPTGPGGPPPRPRRTGLWVALLAGVLVVTGGVAAAAVLAAAGQQDPVASADAATEPGPAVTVAPAEPGQDLSPRQLAERYGDAIWRVEADGCGSRSTGTAFAVDERTLVTNWHVTVNDPAPQVVSRDGATTLDATVIGWSSDPDVAVLTVGEDLPVALRWADADDLGEGQELVAMGFPLPASDFTVTGSNILSFDQAGGERRAIRADGVLDKGNSGGPALTLDGRVAGIVTEMEENRDGYQPLIPLVYTYDHVDEALARITAAPTTVEADCDAFADAGGPVGGADTYGDDAELDALWDACEGGDLGACDELYWSTPVGSRYEEFGSTCGDRGEHTYGGCAADGGGASGDADRYGDDPALDALWDACEDGDLGACDELYWGSPIDSAYEAFGSTCGERSADRFGGCELGADDAAAEGADAYGDDATLDALWDGCVDGDLVACDDLYWDSPVGSEYEAFGATCGDRRAPTYGGCA